MQQVKRIYLIGSRGSGKTSVGKGLAQKLLWDFVDTDAYLCESQGKTVEEIVEAGGWETFRDCESSALVEASEGEMRIIATGGGMVLRAQNREFMRNHGVVVFLDVPAQELARRLRADPLDAQRPSLTDKPLLEEIKEVLAARLELYMESAHIAVDGAQGVGEIIDNILELLETKPVS